MLERETTILPFWRLNFWKLRTSEWTSESSCVKTTAAATSRRVRTRKPSTKRGHREKESSRTSCPWRGFGLSSLGWAGSGLVWVTPAWIGLSGLAGVRPVRVVGSRGFGTGLVGLVLGLSEVALAGGGKREKRKKRKRKRKRKRKKKKREKNERMRERLVREREERKKENESARDFRVEIPNI